MQEPEPNLDELATAPPLERRAFIRLPSDLISNCRPAGRQHDVSWPGQVRDVSCGGLGLLMQHRFRPGTVLDVELHDRSGKILRTVQVRVAHATAVLDDGRHAWLLGCAFAAPLSSTELDELRQIDQ